MRPFYNFDRIWNAVKRTALGKLVQWERDLPLALDIHRGTRFAPSFEQMFGEAFLRKPIPAMRGASGYGDESRRWLNPDIAGVMDFSGTGSEGQFYVMDYFLIDLIGFAFSVAGTTTACKIDFDLYPAPNAAGTIIASNLDGTNGTVTAANITTAMAIGAVNYKSLADTGQVLARPGNSVDIDVATACTAGTGAMAFVAGFPKPDEFANLAAGFIGT